jgi:hypothetical protein
LSHQDFIDLVKTMRALGAVRVRSGALEVAFSGPEMRDEPRDEPLIMSAEDAAELSVVRRLAEEVP